MQCSRRFKPAGGLALALTSHLAWAHNGHGLTGSHWHATDVGGFLALAALVALAVCLSRHGK
ncbi:MAG: hypothetical protein EXR34_10745 [Rhodoferax sp.]|nr:hypothetical protein [Rhodoferax sp.]